MGIEVTVVVAQVDMCADRVVCSTKAKGFECVFGGEMRWSLGCVFVEISRVQRNSSPV
jgi:hypothetical protein